MLTEEGRVRAELKAAGLSIKGADRGSTFIREAMHLLQPEIHEGTVVSFGVVSVPTLNGISAVGRIIDGSFPIESARRLADGAASFVLIHAGQYAGLLVLHAPCRSEKAFVQLQDKLHGIVAVTDSVGRTKFFTEDGMWLHEFRRWRRKPPATEFMNSVGMHFDSVNRHVLRQIVSFCYDTLSPSNTGSTIVWYVATPTAEALARAKAQGNAVSLNIGLSGESDAALAHALLARTDGAALLDDQGKMFGFEAQLVVSEKSREIIPVASGTRRTSARRYSYDFPEAIVFTVSADGPVSVFSDGLTVAELALMDASSFARFVVPTARKYGREDAYVTRSEHVCGRCGKTSVVVDTDMSGWRTDESARCMVCREIILERYTMDLSTQVVKKLP